jgi:hypothetical protein
LRAARHQALTLIAPLTLGSEQSVDAWLRGAERELQRALERTTTTHFARWVVLPPDDAARVSEAPHLLAFESNFDGELSDHVAELRACLGSLLDGAFQHVAGYPGHEDLAALIRFFRGFSLRTAVYYTAPGTLSVHLVRRDAALRRALEERLRQLSHGARVQRSEPLELAADLQRTARAWASREGWTLGPVEQTRRPAAPSVWRRVLARPLRVLGALLLVLGYELRDRRTVRSPQLETPEQRAKRDAIGREEGRVRQNGLTHLVPIQPGRYRAFAFEAMVYLVSAFVEAKALGRPPSFRTLHFARWVPLPDRRLLFFSNYDGSWEAHLGEWLDRAAVVLTAIWTHTRGFPKTRGLLGGGAKDEAAFKAWVRAHQVPTQVWYSAYPGLSVGDIRRNAQVRELLGSPLSVASAQALLELL